MIPEPSPRQDLPLEPGPTPPPDPAAHRLALVDELDGLVERNKDRRLVSVTLGLFTMCLIMAIETKAALPIVGGSIAFAVFLMLMMKPIRRFARIEELRKELAEHDRVHAGSGELPRSPEDP